MNKLKLAMIGCGTIVQRIHLPVAARSDQVEVTLLVDKDLDRAREIADQFGVPAVADDYRQAIQKAKTGVDAAIVAIPNFLHGPASIELLQAGIHVLVEKPMALTGADCEAMIQTAAETGATLTVGLNSRFYWATRFAKQAITSGLLGEIKSFELHKGGIFSWPVASSYTFNRTLAGGGVLMDIGPHVLDLLLWWLGDWKSFVYRDDAVGGVEANCELELTMENGVTGTIELSRDRKMPNQWILRGERATLEIGSGSGAPPSVRLYVDGHPETILSGHATLNGVADTRHHAPYERQLADFCEAIRDRREPFVGKQGKKNIELIEACYAARQPIHYPWAFEGSIGADKPEPKAAPELEVAP